MKRADYEYLEEEIEKFAPPWLKTERAAFYVRLRNKVQGVPVSTVVSNDVSDGYTFVLNCIWIAYLKYVSLAALNRRTSQVDRTRFGAQFSKKQKHIVKQLQRLEGDPNIKTLHYELYAPQEVRCRHRRARKECEKLFSKRAQLLLLNHRPLNKYIRLYLNNLQAESGNLLESRSEDYCEPLPLQFQPPVMPIVREGRPRNDLIAFLMKEIVNWVRAAARWNISKSLRLLGDILFLCFGEKYEEDTLRKRLQRYPSAHQSP